MNLNITKEYKTFKLDNVSFNVEEGHIVGFIGRNGAGKTTTIKSILNIVKPNYGNVKFFGLDLYANENIIKNQIGYSSGTTNYYPRKKLIDIINVTKTFYKDWDDNIMEEYKELFQLDLSKTPNELSDGMKVKFNLLLALSHSAKVLILDEPTSGLDPFSEMKYWKCLLNLLAEALRFLPGLGVLNSSGFENIGVQLLGLSIGIFLYFLFTYTSIKFSIKEFEEIDL